MRESALESACDGRGARTRTAAGHTCRQVHRLGRQRRRQQQPQQRLQRKHRVHTSGQLERQRAQSPASLGITLVQTPSVCHHHGPEEEEVLEDQVGTEVQEAHHRHRQGCHFGHLQQAVCLGGRRAVSTQGFWRSQCRSLVRFGNGDAGR